MHRIGVMQGRLLRPIDGRVQAFPRDGWRDEFPLAAEIGFAAMELTIEMASWDIHPVRDEKGRAALKALSADHGVRLAGLCCDTFMEFPLTGADDAVRRRGREILFDLLEDGAALGLPMIELPMLGDNSLARAQAPAAFEAILDEALEYAGTLGIDILLETDLPGPDFAAFVARHRHPRLGINYDTGNSTWFGFEPEDEIPVYGQHIRNVHIKDCTRADYSVPLGQGETRFAAIGALLKQAGYAGGFILQTARQTDDVAAARDFFAFTKAFVTEHLGR